MWWRRRIWAPIPIISIRSISPPRRAPTRWACSLTGRSIALAERNVYRASLIAYQRARRDFMALSDTIELQVRRDLRQLDQLRVQFEISRQQLLSAARQFENARIILLGPRSRRSANDTTTLNLLQALETLVAARNGLAQNYINYEQQRVQLLLDLEALQLDPRGFPLRDSLQTQRPRRRPPISRTRRNPPHPRNRSRPPRTRARGTRCPARRGTRYSPRTRSPLTPTGCRTRSVQAGCG